MGSGFDIILVGIAARYQASRSSQTLSPQNHEEWIANERIRTERQHYGNIDALGVRGTKDWETIDRYLHEQFPEYDKKNRIPLSHVLAENPSMPNPPIIYFNEQSGPGWANGAGLGYILSNEGSSHSPELIKQGLLARIPELIERFPRELKEKGIDVDPSKVGVYTLNVYDT